MLGDALAIERTFRACLSSYIVMTICFGLIPAIALPIALHGDKRAAEVAAAGIVALLFAYFWLFRFKLTLRPDSFTYSSLFTGEHTINYSEITQAGFHVEGSGARVRWLLQLTVEGRKLRFNTKVFPREAVLALFRLVSPNQPLEIVEEQYPD